MLYYKIDDPQVNLTEQDVKNKALPTQLPRFLGLMDNTELETYGFRRAPQLGYNNVQFFDTDGYWKIRDKTQTELDAEDQEQLEQQAQAELEKNDKIYIRHGKKSMAFNQEWKTYDEALRDIVKGTSTTMPTKPTTYPDGESV